MDKKPNNRLLLSTAVSLLLHLLAFYLLAYLLTSSTTRHVEKNIAMLVVNLLQTSPQSLPPKPESSAENKKLLTTPASASFSIAQSHRKPAQPVTEEISGIAFPAAVATPFQGQSQAHNPFAPVQTMQADPASAYQQQSKEIQARQQNEQQAQLIIQQLHQHLTEILQASPTVSGICQVTERADAKKTRLSCTPSTLHALFRNDQSAITSRFLALRKLGFEYSGFSVENQPENPAIKLLISNKITK